MRPSWRRYRNWRRAKEIVHSSTKPTTISSDKSTCRIRKCTDWANNLTIYKINESEIYHQNKTWRPKSDRFRGSSMNNRLWQRSNPWVVSPKTLYKIQSSTMWARSIAAASWHKGTLYNRTPFRLEWARKSLQEAPRKSDKANYSLTNNFMRRRSDQMPTTAKASSACWERDQIPKRVRVEMRIWKVLHHLSARK